MTNNTKQRLLNDLEALRSSLAELEATQDPEAIEDDAIPTLVPDNIPVLGDAVPADKEDAIQAHREAMAQLDAEIRDIEVASSATRDIGENDRIEQSVANSAGSKAAPILESDNSKASLDTQEEVYPDAIQDRSVVYSSNTVPQSLDIMDTLKSLSTQASVLTQSEDNPFLPLHLRERLNKSKNSLLEEIARSSQSIDASTALLQSVRGSDKLLETYQPAFDGDQAALDSGKALVDMLVAKYLPVIEAELRQRLISSLQKAEAADIA